ncbi:MAG: protein phosphatase 2C domain-containing protein [Prevotellaceae bacterium]|nr:protein phosphatase 2C domain-containing protein [Prevotellaceae bacterium]
MEINKFLQIIDVPATDEKQLNNFISLKRKEIENAVKKLWNEYSDNAISQNPNAILSDPNAISSEMNAISSEMNTISSEMNTFSSEMDAFSPEMNAFLSEINAFSSKVNTFLSKINTFTTEIDEKFDTKLPETNTFESQYSSNLLTNNENSQTDMKFGEENNTPEHKEEAKNKAFDIQTKNKEIKFPFGKVNQEYSINFDIESLGIPALAKVTFIGLESIGLQYYPDEKQIRGIPTVAGDHKIIMRCTRKDLTENRPLFERDVNLVINPDPRLLWNNIPTPANIEYYKPDEDKAFIKVESEISKGFLGFGKKEYLRKDMVAASQRGRSHAHEGKARDDDFALNFDKEIEWYTMVVADGAGSAKYSRKGSQIACETVINVCKEQLSSQNKDFETNIRLFANDKSQENHNKMVRILYDIIGKAAFCAYKNIKDEAEKYQYPLKDYSTTLLLSISKKFDFGWFIAAFWVGDGGIGIYRKEPEYLEVLGEPDGGEFAGQTRFLTMSEIFLWESMAKRLRFDIVPDFTALILMTDGITDPKFETDANLNRIEKWHELWDDLQGKNEENAKVDFTDDNEQAADQLLKWLDFWSRGNHDDRTIAILF